MRSRGFLALRRNRGFLALQMLIFGACGLQIRTNGIGIRTNERGRSAGFVIQPH
jgi:hypothetical protein